MILEHNPYLDELVQTRRATSWRSSGLTLSLAAIGVCFAIIATLRYLRLSDQTSADELAACAAAFFAGAIAFSVVLASRGRTSGAWFTWTFGIGAAILAISTLSLLIDLF
jgi:hypothetical protein